MKSVLSIDRYKTLLAAYGARLELWPEAEREAARELLSSSAEARELAQAEAGLDALFAASESPELSPALSRKLAELPVVHAQPRRLWPFRRVWVPVLAWAAAAAFGIAIGTMAPDPENAGAEASAALETSAPSGAEEDEDEFLEIALGSLDELEELP